MIGYILVVVCVMGCIGVSVYFVVGICSALVVSFV